MQSNSLFEFISILIFKKRSFISYENDK